jgi:hypothetical protein
LVFIATIGILKTCGKRILHKSGVHHAYFPPSPRRRYIFQSSCWCDTHEPGL